MRIQYTLDQLPQMAQRFWEGVSGARVFAVHGAMGAGKTTTIAALCRHLGVTDAVSSPTFSIINEYAFPNGIVYHLDLYRLETEDELHHSGVEDAVRSGHICFVEWPERGAQLFDDETVHLLLTPLDENTRMLEVLTTEALRTLTLREHL